MEKHDLLTLLYFPADEDAEEVLWLAELIQSLRRFAEGASQPEVATIVEEAYTAALAAADLADRNSLN